MLKHRIIPVLLTNGKGQCVKPVAFQRPYRKLGTMEQYIRVVESRDVDELFIIDIEATAQDREPDFEKVRSWANNLFCPLTYGGGIRTVDHIRDALQNGADKVAIRHKWDLVLEAATKFGSQAIVAVIDYHPTDNIFSIQEHVKVLEKLGAGEIVLTNMGKDGKLEGYDLYTLNVISNSVDIPVIALGGCGEPRHMAEALENGASAVAAGSMFLYTDYTPKNCANLLNIWGIPVRVDNQIKTEA